MPASQQRPVSTASVQSNGLLSEAIYLAELEGADAREQERIVHALSPLGDPTLLRQEQYDALTDNDEMDCELAQAMDVFCGW